MLLIKLFIKLEEHNRRFEFYSVYALGFEMSGHKMNSDFLPLILAGSDIWKTNLFNPFYR